MASRLSPRSTALFFIRFTVILWLCSTLVSALTIPGLDRLARALQGRTPPTFPEYPDTCPICAKDYDSIQGCAEAAPVFQNFTNVIFNPGAFIDTIRCACTDTFKAVFPQCVDCFIKTGQEDQIMGHTDLPAVVEGVRRICAVSSSLLGNVTAANNASRNAPSSAESLVGYSMADGGWGFGLGLAVVLASLGIVV